MEATHVLAVETDDGPEYSVEEIAAVINESLRISGLLELEEHDMNLVILKTIKVRPLSEILSC